MDDQSWSQSEAGLSCERRAWKGRPQKLREEKLPTRSL